MHDIEQLAFISTDIAALLCCGFITPICRVFFAKASGLGEISVLNCALNKLRIEFSLKFSWSVYRQVRTEAFEAIITAAIEALVYDKYNEANRKFRKKFEILYHDGVGWGRLFVVLNILLKDLKAFSQI